MNSSRYLNLFIAVDENFILIVGYNSASDETVLRNFVTKIIQQTHPKKNNIFRKLLARPKIKRIIIL